MSIQFCNPMASVLTFSPISSSETPPNSCGSAADNLVPKHIPLHSKSKLPEKFNEGVLVDRFRVIFLQCCAGFHQSGSRLLTEGLEFRILLGEPYLFDHLRGKLVIWDPRGVRGKRQSSVGSLSPPLGLVRDLTGPTLARTLFSGPFSIAASRNPSNKFVVNQKVGSWKADYRAKLFNDSVSPRWSPFHRRFFVNVRRNRMFFRLGNCGILRACSQRRARPRNSLKLSVPLPVG